MQTTLATVVKTPLWDKTREDYRDAAGILIGCDATREQLDGFQAYWDQRAREATAAGKTYPYRGKPALKSLLEEWQNYIANKNVAGNAPSWQDDVVVFDPPSEVEA